MKKSLFLWLLSVACWLQAEEAITLYPAKMLYVIDGDTIKAEYKGKEESIRLLGIDTFEIKKSYKGSIDKAKKQASIFKTDLQTIYAMGDLGKKTLQSLLPQGSTIQLEYDKFEDRGGWNNNNRLLAYVWYQGKLVNVEMVRQGAALLYMNKKGTGLVVVPHKRVNEFKSAYSEAKGQNRQPWNRPLRTSQPAPDLRTSQTPEEQIKKTFELIHEVTPVVKDSKIYPQCIQSMRLPEQHNVPVTELKPKLNLNTASYFELIKIKGIGKVLANRIIEYRQANRLGSPEELLKVKGIGEGLLMQIQEQYQLTTE